VPSNVNFPMNVIHVNLSVSQLMTHALSRGEGKLSEDGALLVTTGHHTGRSACDKFIVDEPGVHDEVWWGKTNNRLSQEDFKGLATRIHAHMENQELYRQDLLVGADPKHQIKIQLFTTQAWHALFACNIFIHPTQEELVKFEPDIVILHDPKFQANPEIDHTNSETVIALALTQGMIVIAGTEYAGEIKKSVFTAMNWKLPKERVLPLHCSGNVGSDGDTALFFGLSGTGKTTLSSDPTRPLIGDDEHGWNDEGVFNFEGGCYAKVIDLSQQAEPEIWNATHCFGTVLENVMADEQGHLDLSNRTLTENTRACYPLKAIQNTVISGRSNRLENIVMLTCDAFGVLPPMSRLTPSQAMYHFLSGYTAKMAGTEKGVGKEPQATFSTCFGAPFLPRTPETYGQMLGERIAHNKVKCWLLNTGWIGGPYGVGKRISIAHTRTLLHAILDRKLDSARFITEPFFGLSIPLYVEGVPNEVLNPCECWPDPQSYEQAANDLAYKFYENFSIFRESVGDDVRSVEIIPNFRTR
jgi:phosphoenolpyruvate carboxykinase (ATP)